MQFKMLNLTPRAQQVINLAKTQAVHTGHIRVEVEHLFLALLNVKRGIAFEVLHKTLENLDELEAEIQDYTTIPDAEHYENVTLGKAVERIFSVSRVEAKKAGNDYVGTEHILLSIISSDNYITNL